MPRSSEQNRLARERTKEAILVAAIELFAEKGVHETTIADITGSAGIAQGLVNYHFGGKDQLIEAVADRWFSIILGFPFVEGDTDARLRSVIDAALSAAVVYRSLQSVVLALAHQPATRLIVAGADSRQAEAARRAEGAVRAIFAERGAADPALEEGMLRTLLEGVAGKYAISGGLFPMELARGWVYRMYDLGEPTTPLATGTDAAPPVGENRP